MLTGFLGSGKTTLLNHVLQTQRDRRLAVIENEYGAVPIDAELVSSRTGAAERLIVMANGCMCCSVRGDLVAILVDRVRPRRRQRARRRPHRDDRHRGPAADHQDARRTPPIGAFSLRAVLTLVDAKNVLGRLREAGAAALTRPPPSPTRPCSRYASPIAR